MSTIKKEEKVMVASDEEVVVIKKNSSFLSITQYENKIFASIYTPENSTTDNYMAINIIFALYSRLQSDPKFIENIVTGELWNSMETDTVH